MISRLLCDLLSAAVVRCAYRRYYPDQPPPDSLEARARNELANWAKCLDERDRLGLAEVPPGVVDELRRVTRGWRVGSKRPDGRLN